MRDEQGVATFMEQCLAGDCGLDDIDDFVDRWHEGGTGLPLWEFLGMTHEEYARWVERAEALPAIVDARRRKRVRGLSV